MNLHQACEKGKLTMVKQILSKGHVDINCLGQDGRTPVMVAARNGQRSVFDFLVSQGCDISVVDEDNDNVLHLACIGGNTDIVRTLLDEDINIESRGRFGRTPIMKAAISGHRGVFAVLQSRGCNLKTRDKENSSLLHVACIGGDIDMISHILFQRVVSIESKGKYGRTPVMEAAGQGQREVFDLLVSQGCNLRVSDQERSTVLHVACIGGDLDMVKYVLSQGIDKECHGRFGRTPLMEVAGQGQIDVFDLLLKEGCNLLALDDQLCNVLHVACIGGDVDMVRHIITMGKVPTDAVNTFSHTPLQEAKSQGKNEVVALLEACLV